MYSTPPRVTPLTPSILLGRLVAMVQEEEEVLHTSVEDKRPGSEAWLPPVTRNTCNICNNCSMWYDYVITITCSPVSPVYAPQPWYHLPSFRAGRSSTKPAVSYLDTVRRVLTPPVTRRVSESTIEHAPLDNHQYDILYTVYYYSVLYCISNHGTASYSS